jgi:SAM-dependent methyltransferase
LIQLHDNVATSIGGLKITGYWDSHYKVFEEDEASPYCKDIVNRILQPNDTVIEIGCGNGRDGLMIARNVKNYIGVDLSPTAIQSAREKFIKSKLPEERYSLFSDDFSQLKFEHPESTRLIIYSRFSLHADSEDAENLLLAHLSNYKSGSLKVLIEARTIHDELYGQGEKVERNAFVSDHFRRFINPQEFLEKVSKNFTVDSLKVERDFAPYKAENPMVMRIEFSN